MALFGKKQEESKEVPKEEPKEAQKPIMPAKTSDARKDTAYLGKSLKITGNVSGVGNLIILGAFKGEFDLKGQLKIAQGSNIKGNVKATNITVNGNVEGTITASEKIHLDNTARIKGRITTPKISVLEGAVVDGEIEMSRQSPQTPKLSSHGQTPLSHANSAAEKK
jgi:cytoskeletal protein CcmA (bactofilin family)